jgi:hypothetical protein
LNFDFMLLSVPFLETSTTVHDEPSCWPGTIKSA